MKQITYVTLLFLFLPFIGYTQCIGGDQVDQPYCYNVDEAATKLTSFCPINPGEVVSINMSGQTEECCDIIHFYSGTNADNTDPELGLISGTFSNHIIYGKPDECLSVYINADFSVNCSNSAFIPLNWTSSCTVPPPPKDGDNCSDPLPLCLSNSQQMLIKSNNSGNSAEAGNDYGCLFQEPDPVWTYFKIEKDGDLSIDINGVEDDVDFAAWGPFIDKTDMLSMCGSLNPPSFYEDPGEDFCSFSVSQNETFILKETLVGEYYLLMITNRAETAQNIELSIGGFSQAETDCELVDDFDIIAFDAQAIDKFNRLNWSTNHEINTLWHIVERAENDSLDFNEIGRVGVENQWLIPINYTFDDIAPKEYSWYRIRTVLKSGQFEFTDPILVERGRNGFHFKRLYPNPVTNLVIAEFIGIEGDYVTIRVMDSSGREVYNESLAPFSGVNTLQFDMGRFTAGVYILFLENGTLRYTRRIVKTSD